MSAGADERPRTRRVSITLDAETAERLDRIAEMDRRHDPQSIGYLLRPLLAEALRSYERERGHERGKAAISRPRRDRGGLRLVTLPEA